MMKTVEVPISTLKVLIGNLQWAVDVCDNIDCTSEDTSKSYPYAVGYSRSAMQRTIKDLNTLKSEIN